MSAPSSTSSVVRGASLPANTVNGCRFWWSMNAKSPTVRKLLQTRQPFTTSYLQTGTTKAGAW